MITRFTRPALRALAVTAALCFVSVCAEAHPGHGLLDHGAGHAITSPYHAGVLAVIGASCWLAARFAARRAVSRRLLRWAGATALLAAVALLAFGP